MEKILVTGGCGFIGRYVVEELLQQGYGVTVLDALIGQVHGGKDTEVPSGVELVRGDVRDRDLLDKALKGVDGVIHLAAEVGVGQSMYEIDRYVGGNDLGTAVLLQALIDNPVRRIVVASSMSVYGEGRYTSDGKSCGIIRRSADRIKAGAWEPVGPDGGSLEPVATDEEKPVDLASIYALTKYVQEKQCLIFGSAYPTEAVALRLFNVFGAGQALSNPYTGVLANFAARLANGRSPMIFEDGRQRRDFVHVDDVAAANLAAIGWTATQQAGAVRAFNVGSGVVHTIGDLAAALSAARGGPAPVVTGGYRLGDVRHITASSARLRAELAVPPAVPFEEGVRAFASAPLRGRP